VGVLVRARPEPKLTMEEKSSLFFYRIQSCLMLVLERVLQETCGPSVKASAVRLLMIQ
jgi:hypothetical protein